MKTDFTPEEFDRGAPHPVQSYAWGEFRKNNGIPVFRFMDSGKSYTVTFHRLPFLPYSIGILTQCHLPNKVVLDYLKKIAGEYKALFIKIEPYFYKTQNDLSKLHYYDTFFTQQGLRVGKPLYPQYSFVIDLSRSEEELFAALKSKTRYNVRLSLKKGVQTSITSDDDSFEEYLALLSETTQRQAFYAHTESYQRNMWRWMKSAQIAYLAKATYQKKPLACFVLFLFNDRLYYPYGASTRDFKEFMAPQLLMWEAMRFGKKKQARELEMWGSLGLAPIPSHPWYGFHRFKEGFGGAHVQLLGAYDLIIHPFGYFLYTFLDIFRWFWLKKVWKR